MAQKERRSLNNFDSDIELDFKFDDFDDMYTPQAESRSPVSKVGRSVIRGAFNALTGFGLIKKVVLKALPREFGEIDSAFSKGIQTGRDLYHESLKDLGPAMRDFNRSLKRAGPALSKELPGKLGSGLEKAIGKLPNLEEPARGASPEELKEQALQAQLGAVFQQGQGQAQIGQQQLVQSMVAERGATIRHGESVKYLNAIRVSTQNLDNYNTAITTNFYRKSLELSMRQLSVQAEMLNDNRRFAAEYMNRLDGIVKNTGLPDYLKLKGSERYAEAIRNRFIGKTLDTATERSREFMSRFGNNIKQAVKDKLDNLKSAFEAGSMGLDAMGDQADMLREMQDSGMSDVSLSEMLSEQAGAGLAERAAMRAGKWFGKNQRITGSNPYQKLGYYGSEAARFLRDPTGSLDAFREGEFLDKVPFMRAFKDLIPSVSVNTAFEKDTVGGLQGAGLYTARTDKTINTVIPGLLSRQLRELTMIRTGNTDVQLLTYDHFKDDFVSKADMTQAIFDRVINKGMKSNVEEEKKRFEAGFYDDQEDLKDFSADAKVKFYNHILNQAILGKGSSPGRFTNEESFVGSGLNYDDIGTLIAHFKKRYGYDEQGKPVASLAQSRQRSKFSSLFKGTADSVSHNQEVIQTLINAGYLDELRRTGLVDNNGNLNRGRYYDHLTGAEFSAQNIQNRPNYEGVAGMPMGSPESYFGQSSRPGVGQQLTPEQIGAQPGQHGGAGTRYTGLDTVVDAIRDANIKTIAQATSETMQRIELILLEKEFGSRGPGALDKLVGAAGSVKKWFTEKFARFSNKYEGVREFMTSTKTRARTMWDFITGLMGKAYRGGKEALKFGWEKGSALAKWGGRQALDGAKRAKEAGMAAGKRAWEFGRDTALPTAKEYGGRAGRWTWDQAGKAKGRISNGLHWVGDRIRNVVDGAQGREGDERSLIGRMLGGVGAAGGWMAGKASDAVGGLFSKIFGKGPMAKQQQVQIDLLRNIRDILDARLPGKKKRKGSWETQYQDREAAAQQSDANEAAADRNDRSGGLLSSLAGMLGLGGRGKKDDQDDAEEEDDGDIIAGSLDMGGGDGPERGNRRPRGPKPKGWRARGARALGGLKNFGRNLISSPVRTIVGGALRGGLGAAKFAGKAAWWLARNTATRLAWPLLKGIGMIVGLKPLLIGAAIAGVGYGLYKGYKWLTKARLGDLSRIRYQQYGFLPDDEGHLQQVMGLEDKLRNFVKFDGDLPRLEDDKIEMKDIIEDFGLDFKNRLQRDNFVKWYAERFKPVYLTWLTAVNSSKTKKDLKSLDSLSSKDKLAMLDLVSFPEGPYNATTSPFPDLKRLPAVESTVRNAITVLRAELETKAKEDTGKTTITENAGAAAAAVTAAQTAMKPATKTDGAPNKTGSVTDPQLKSAVAATATVMAAQRANTERAATFTPEGDKIIRMDMRELSPIESIRLRVYGLTDAAATRASAILRLEEMVRRTAISQGDKVVWKGSVLRIAQNAAALFQFPGVNSNAGETWMAWFTRRFLPTYLSYLTALYNLTGSFDRDSDLKRLTPTQAVDLANRISAATFQERSVWEVTYSPFENYQVGTSPDAITPFISVIARAAEAGAQLKEEAKKHMDAQSAAAAERGGSVPVSNRRPDPVQPGLLDRLSKAYDNWDTTAGRATKAVVSGAKALGHAATFGIFRQAADVNEGTGGLYNQLPDPKGPEGYAAYKDMIEAAAKMVGVNPKLLAIISAIESSFRPYVKAPTSSATGLFQFIKKTWQGMVARFGKQFGISSFIPPSDPKAACIMGALFLKDNIQYLQKALKRPVTFVEAYMAHFLGPAGAATALKYSPDTILAPLMPKAAASNRSIFMDGNRAKSLGEILADFSKKFVNYARHWGIELDESSLTNIADSSGDAKADAKQDVAVQAEAAALPKTPAPTPDQVPAPGTTPSPVGGGQPQSPAGGFVKTSAPAPASGGAAVPAPQSAPSPINQTPPRVAETNAKQEIADAKMALDTSRMEEILSQSLKVQVQQAALLAEISAKLNNLPSANIQTVPDTRKKPIDQSRPMPSSVIDLRRSA